MATPFFFLTFIDYASEIDERVIKEIHGLLIKENRDDALILKKEYQSDRKLVLTMIVLEPDQSIAEFCGNGARVVSCYLQHKLGDPKIEYYLKTSRGMRKMWWEDGLFYVDMGKTQLRSRKRKFFNQNFETFKLGLGMKQFTFFRQKPWSPIW